MRRSVLIALVVIVLAGLAAGGWYFKLRDPHPLPPGFTVGNGRIEADEVDVSTKYAGRVAEILVDEGDMVAAGDVVARMDVRETEAQRRTAEAKLREAQETRRQTMAQIDQTTSAQSLADKDLERAERLLKGGYVSQSVGDAARDKRDQAVAALAAANAAKAAAEQGIAAAQGEVDRLERQIEDATLIAPRAGRVLYRLAEPGEVLAAGGKVVTLLDLGRVYMTIYLPADAAAAAPLGGPARVVLDLVPDMPIPARVSFVSPQAQFTPKQVETRSERDKMMYRVKVRLPEQLVSSYSAQAKTGVTGVAYVRLTPDAVWPDWLESDLTRRFATMSTEAPLAPPEPGTAPAPAAAPASAPAPAAPAAATPAQPAAQ